MDQAKLEAFRKRLLQERNILSENMKRNHRFGLAESLSQSVGELSSYDHHPADLGTEMFERGKDLALSERSERQIQEIEAALRRIDAGTYGICEVCKKPIPEERLEAVPWTRTCVAHHPKSSISHEQPVEEEVRSSFQRSKDHRYDRIDVWEDIEEYGTTNQGTIDDLKGFRRTKLMGGFSLADLEEELDERGE